MALGLLYAKTVSRMVHDIMTPPRILDRIVAASMSFGRLNSMTRVLVEKLLSSFGWKRIPCESDRGSRWESLLCAEDDSWLDSGDLLIRSKRFVGPEFALLVSTLLIHFPQALAS